MECKWHRLKGYVWERTWKNTTSAPLHLPDEDLCDGYEFVSQRVFMEYTFAVLPRPISLRINNASCVCVGLCGSGLGKIRDGDFKHETPLGDKLNASKYCILCTMLSDASSLIASNCIVCSVTGILRNIVSFSFVLCSELCTIAGIINPTCLVVDG